ncbi:MAG: hypothetical protein AAF721_28065 [Myxococcota bacterium]
MPNTKLWPVLVVSAAAGSFAAWAVARQPSPLPTRPVEVRGVGPPAAAGERSPVALHRNIFCPGCSNAVVEEVEPSPPSGASPGLPTGLRLHLVGTMEGVAGGPSYATVYDADAGTVGLYAAADALRPGVVLDRVERGMLHITHGDRRETIAFGGAPPQARAMPARRGHRAPPRAPGPFECPTESLCIVERAFVESLLANPARLAGQARFAPNVVDGRTQGYAIGGIRRGSIPKLLGLENKDVLMAVNGVELTSIDAVMALYGNLRRASHLQIELLRNGARRTREIQIR